MMGIKRAKTRKAKYEPSAKGANKNITLSPKYIRMADDAIRPARNHFLVGLDSNGGGSETVRLQDPLGHSRRSTFSRNPASGDTPSLGVTISLSGLTPWPDGRSSGD